MSGSTTSLRSVDEFFAGRPLSRSVFDAVLAAIARVGDCDVRVSRSQVAFRRRRGFAWTWIPGMYLTGPRPPLVLSIALRRRDGSPRWKQVVEPRPGRFMHHLELASAAGIDDEVIGWLSEAWRDSA